ncbi:ras association domain-containing protein 5 [Antennarius striatus]|uniref:ras association domain-containing protein 5 n=1 Tax=Antennarius striatus TaxID=241820 RepID=UPI0035AE4F7B
MAFASVVGQHPGQHRLASEPPLLLLKLSGGRKKISPPRKPSWEKVVFGSSSEPGSVTAGEAGPRTHRWSPRPAGGGSVVRGQTSGDGCVTAAAPAPTRRPDRDGQRGCTGCDRRTTAGSRAGRTGRVTGDCNSNVHCDSNRNAAGRNAFSVKTRSVNVMSNASVRDGDEAAPGRRDTWSGSRTHDGPAASLPLDRLTQGRTGVVKLARTEPPRREAWSIFPRGADPRVRAERGEGHRFETTPVTRDWCDACSRQITAETRKCRNCSYTCHLECERNVQLDCNQRDKEPKQTSPPRSHRSSSTPQYKPNEAKEEVERETKDLSEEDVRRRIEEYNAHVSENGMKLASDGSFTGFIKVHLRLSRPVTVPDVERVEGASRQTDSTNQALSECLEETDYEHSDNRTSFYLPCDCMKQLHISSLNTTREVIQGLLKKFMVLDNPRKFALYRQTHRHGQDLFQKLPLCERPLLLRLIEGPDPQQLSFVLKENETEEVEWHAFSVPELQNFLVILGKEEAERVRAVEQKYAVYRQKLQQALRQHDP